MTKKRSRCIPDGAEKRRKVYVWKFTITKWTKLHREQVDIDEGIEAPEIKDCFAAAVAHDVDAAKKIISKACMSFGEDARWLDVADVKRLPASRGTFIGLVLA